VKVVVNTAKKRKLCSSSLNPDLLLEERQAPAEDVQVLGTRVRALQQEHFGEGLRIRTDTLVLI